MTGVYAIVHRASGRRYVGSSSVIGRRWYEHLHKLARNRHHSTHLQNAWNKYGAAEFDFVVVETCAHEALIAREQAWIDWAQASDPSCGFNVAPIAGAPSMTPESIERGAAKRRGRKRPSEVGRKIAAALRGQPLSEERKAKISEAHKGKKRGPHSDIHRARIREASLKYRHSPESKDKIAANHWSRSPRAAEVLARTAETRKAKKQLALARALPLLSAATSEVTH